MMKPTELKSGLNPSDVTVIDHGGKFVRMLDEREVTAVDPAVSTGVPLFLPPVPVCVRSIITYG